MILLLDNFDSYTYNLVHAIEQFGVECHVVRNNVSIDHIQSLNFSAAVLSPGPEIPARSGCLNQFIEKYHNRIPMLGVCLGHQALGEYFGMELVKATLPKHGKITALSVDNKSVLFDNLPVKFDVVQYNSLVVTGAVSPLKITAKSADNEVMAFEHLTLPLFGVQFHPEAACSQHGDKLIKNWLLHNRLIN